MRHSTVTVSNNPVLRLGIVLNLLAEVIGELVGRTRPRSVRVTARPPKLGHLAPGFRQGLTQGTVRPGPGRATRIGPVHERDDRPGLA